MKNITFSAEACVIKAARSRARSEQSTLNEQFRRWLADYAQAPKRMDRYDAVMEDLRGKLKSGRKLGRGRRAAASASAARSSSPARWRRGAARC